MPHVIVAKDELPLCLSYHRSEGHCHSRTFVVHASGRMTQTEWLKSQENQVTEKEGKFGEARTSAQ